MTKNRPSKITAQILWVLVAILIVVLIFRWPAKPTGYPTSSAAISAHT